MTTSPIINKNDFKWWAEAAERNSLGNKPTSHQILLAFEGLNDFARYVAKERETSGSLKTQAKKLLKSIWGEDYIGY